MPTTVKAYYDGSAFVPVKPINIQAGKVFVLSVLQEDSSISDAVKKVVAFRHITNNLHKINHTEPLSPEFDDIIAQRIHFNQDINI